MNIMASKYKYTDPSLWLKNEIPALKEKYNIHKGRRSMAKAKRVAIVVANSFLESVAVPKAMNAISIATMLEKHIYNLAYENELECDRVPEATGIYKYISLHVGYDDKPEKYNKDAIRIMDILLEGEDS